MTPSNILAKIQALIDRALGSPFPEEARTSAMIAARLIAEHNMLSGILVVREVDTVIVHEVERVVVPTSPQEIERIIREHQRERARRGGEARARKLTPERQREISHKAASTPRRKKGK